jgi:hypothetical protein
VFTRRWRLALILLLTAAASIIPVFNAGAKLAISPSSPCSVATTTNYEHVVWIVLENVGYSVIGSPSARYLNGLASACGLATNYDAIAHPSLPNYVAMTSGSTQGITDDNEPSAHPLRAPSIFSELGSNWRAFAESMPSPCDRVTSGQYAARHNPAVYFLNVARACRVDDIALTQPLDLSAAFTFIAPNICDDMHSCAVGVGDAWLRQLVPTILASPQYQTSSLVLFITFDENDSQASNRVPTLVIAPSVARGEQVGIRFNHYSLLATTETLLHLKLLAAARSARSMVTPFHL